MRARQQRLLSEALPRLSLQAPAPTSPQTQIDPASAFGRETTSLFLEIGFGGGEHALEQHSLNPGTSYIASEVFENGLCSLLSRLVPEGEESDIQPPDNFRIWPDDARTLLRKLPDRCLDRVYLMFPDPWPKARHTKRRFVHPDNLALLARVLKPGATWRIASDHPVYQDWVETVMSRQVFFDGAPPARKRPEGWSPTRYESKAFKEKRQPLYWTFTRRG